jgi:hypothetical protein
MHTPQRQHTVFRCLSTVRWTLLLMFLDLSVFSAIESDWEDVAPPNRELRVPNPCWINTRSRTHAGAPATRSINGSPLDNLCDIGGTPPAYWSLFVFYQGSESSDCTATQKRMSIGCDCRSHLCMYSFLLKRWAGQLIERVWPCLGWI